MMLRASAATALVLLLGCHGCESCRSEPVIAELRETSGTVERDGPQSAGKWGAAVVGNVFRVGDGLRTGTDSSAVVEFPSGSGLALRSNTTIRFAEHASRQGTGVSIETGAAELESRGGSDAYFHAGFGLAVIEPGGRVRVERRDDVLDLTVVVGRASFDKPGEDRTVLGVGQSIHIDIHRAIIEPADVPPVPDAGVANQDAAVVDAGEDAGLDASTSPSNAEALPSKGRLPTRADFALSAGESPFVHVRGGKAAVRMELGESCPEGGTVELVRGRRSFSKAHIRARGTSSVILPVARGLSRYRVRCAGNEGKLVSGSIRVLADSGRRRLPVSGPKNTVEADGRRYTVLYQNILPELTFAWTDSPSARGYALHIEGRDGFVRTVESERPSAVFRPGQIPEGTYRWWFQSLDASRTKSRVTTLVLDFDNATPAAYLQSPGEGDVLEGATVRVAGAAMKGASVSVRGTALDLDRHSRFEAELPMNDEQDTVAVRIQHPRLGIHYYLRGRLRAR